LNRCFLRVLRALAWAAALFLVAASAVWAQSFPEYHGYVNDYAGLLNVQARDELEARLVQLEKDTTAEVAVVTIKSLEGNSVDDYAVRLFEKWKIGKKETNNGILMLVALDDREMRIEVGYGLEAVITDGRAGRIRDEQIIPRFKDGDYQGGINAGVEAIEKYIRDGTPPEPLEENPVRSLFGDFVTVFIFLTVITVYLSGFMARSASIWLGGIWGAIAGAVLGLSIGGVAALVITTFLSSGLGLGIDALLSRNYQKQVAAGESTKWHRTWGGFGGGGWGSGGGGGGFGGFGGGGSGGGGASGGW
jgi:uncharacterized protein